MMGDTLVAVGRTDPSDADETAATLATVRALLAMCRAHVAKENDFVHPAIEARAPGASGRIDGEHVEHLQSIADLHDDVAVVEAASDATRDAALLRLYHRLSAFVADNFRHMLVEETAHNAALWSHYDDDELLALEHRLRASIPPAEMATVLRWMVPAVDATTRARMLAALRDAMPPAAYAGIRAVVDPTLSAADRAKLDRALAN